MYDIATYTLANVEKTANSQVRLDAVQTIDYSTFTPTFSFLYNITIYRISYYYIQIHHALFLMQLQRVMQLPVPSTVTVTVTLILIIDAILL